MSSDPDSATQVSWFVEERPTDGGTVFMRPGSHRVTFFAPDRPTDSGGTVFMRPADDEPRNDAAPDTDIGS